MRIGHKRNTVKVIYVKFDDQNAGLVTMQSNIIARQQRLVSIQKCEVSFPIKKNKPNPSGFCLGHVQYIRYKGSV